MKFFPKNIGKRDRLIRLALAILLLIAAIWQKSWILLVVSLFVFFEVLMSWCVVYQIFGKSSCPVKKGKKKH